jgi:hypothetical protein
LQTRPADDVAGTLPNLIQINTIGSHLVLHSPKSAFAMEEAPMLSHDHPDGVTRSNRAFLTSPAGLAVVGLLAIAGAYLWIEHRAHLLAALVWLPIVGCLLMHVFMHHGHGGHGNPAVPSRPPSDNATP